MIRRLQPIPMLQVQKQLLHVLFGVALALSTGGIVAAGDVWGWGANVSGSLGDGTALPRHTPVEFLPPGEMPDVVEVAAGRAHSLALCADGSVWAWGTNLAGQLGDGTRIDRWTPVKVLTSVPMVAVAAGANHSLAAGADGSVWSWGLGAEGQLGDGAYTPIRTRPFNVVRTSAMPPVVGVAGGWVHSLALCADGSIWGWGRGRIGDGTRDDQLTPIKVAVPTDMPRAVGISAGGSHSLAVCEDGSVWGWGWNSRGELGDGTQQTERLTPIRMLTPDEMAPAVAVAGGSNNAGSHSLVLCADGSIWGCGQNALGQLGDGTTTRRVLPVKVAAPTDMPPAVAISGTGNHSLAACEDGSVWGWGFNRSGQVGDGTVLTRLAPVAVAAPDAMTGVRSVAAGFDHSLALAPGITNTAPEVTCPAGAFAECVGGGANIRVEAGVFDADGDPLLVEWLVTFPDGTTTIVSDTVTFDDPPVPVAVGLVDPDGSPENAFFFPHGFPHGNSTVDLRVTDGIAGTYACSPVTIMVEDTQGPVIVMLMDLIEVGNDPGECFAIVDLESPEYAPLFADACSPDVVATHDAPEGFQFPIGQTTVIWTVYDGHGNTTTATQIVVVSDIEPPTATAPPDIVVPHDPGTCEASILDLGTPMASDNCGVVSISNTSTGVFMLGTTMVGWYVEDAAGHTTVVTQTVTVTNADPVADAGDDQFVECASQDGTKVQLDGTGSSDPDIGDILSYQWSAVGITFDDETSATPSADFPMGSTTVTLQVIDQCGAMSTSDVIIVVEDTTAPQLQALVADHQVLWPPNHKFVPVCVDLLVRDTCAHPEDLNMVCTVSSSEPDDSLGDGATTGDVNGSDGYSSPVPLTLTYDAESGNWVGAIFLRAERNGGGDGRKYALICTVTDEAGNSTSATACIVVPHDQRGSK